jgi:hypothetical protein
MLRLRCIFALLTLLLAAGAHAQGFAALVSPPRFELTAKPGQLVHQVLEVSNRATQPADYLIHTADWTLAPDYGVNFLDALQPDSCRPWVSLERPEAQLRGGSTLRYRFEVAVPQDAPPGECRFGVLIESKEAAAPSAGVPLPIAGRIGVIVYVKVADAAPQLEILGPKVQTLNGRRIPALRIHNGGNAHGRLTGFLSGKDASGARFDFSPSDFPILAGDTADVYLVPSDAANENPTLTYPVRVSGTLEWANRKTELDETFE